MLRKPPGIPPSIPPGTPDSFPITGGKSSLASIATFSGIRAGSEPMVLGGLETAVVSAGVVAYTIDAPARARVLVARVP